MYSALFVRCAPLHCNLLSPTVATGVFFAGAVPFAFVPLIGFASIVRLNGAVGRVPATVETHMNAWTMVENAEFETSFTRLNLGLQLYNFMVTKSRVVTMAAVLSATVGAGLFISVGR